MATCLPANISMEGFIRIVNGEYHVKIERLKRIDDRRFEADTGNGKLYIEKVLDCKDRAAFLNGLYEYIKNRGFSNIIEIQTSSQGRYFTELAGGFYIVYGPGYGPMHTMEGYEEKIMRAVARFHSCSEGYIPPSGSKCKSSWGKCIDKYNDGLREIKRYKDSIRAEDIRSPFETIFLRNCDRFIGMAEEALEMLCSSGYLDVVEDSMKRQQICIGSIKPSNWGTSGADVFVRSIGKCRYDIPEADIALFFRETVKSGSWICQERVENLIEIYNGENNMNKHSIGIVKAFLLYPETYLKTCIDYSREGFTVGDSIYIKKLHEAENFEEAKNRLVEMFDSILIGGDADFRFI